MGKHGAENTRVGSSWSVVERRSKNWSLIVEKEETYFDFRVGPSHA